VAELSVKKGSAVNRIEGTSRQGSGLARTQVTPPPRKDGEEKDTGQGGEEPKEFAEFLVEIGEEARRNARQGQGEAAEAEGGPKPERDEDSRKQGVKVDVVI